MEKKKNETKKNETKKNETKKCRRWISLILCLLYLGSYLYANSIYLYALIAPEKAEKKIIATYIEKSELQEELPFEFKTTLGKLGGFYSVLSEGIPQELKYKLNDLRIEGWLSINLRTEHIYFQISILQPESEVALLNCLGMSTNTAIFLKNENTASAECIEFKMSNQEIIPWITHEIENLRQGRQSDFKMLLDEKYQLEGFQLKMSATDTNNRYLGIRKQLGIDDTGKKRIPDKENKLITCNFYLSEKEVGNICFDIENAKQIDSINWVEIVTSFVVLDF